MPLGLGANSIPVPRKPVDPSPEVAVKKIHVSVRKLGVLGLGISFLHVIAGFWGWELRFSEGAPIRPQIDDQAIINLEPYRPA